MENSFDESGPAGLAFYGISQQPPDWDIYSTVRFSSECASMICCRSLLIIVLLLLTHVPAWADRQKDGADKEFVISLMARADALRLSETRYWQKLLHYRPRLLGTGVISQIDDPDFFLSPYGKISQRSELNATIEFLFSENPPKHPTAVDRCSFIARYHWLKDQLNFPETQSPLWSCDEFDKWYEAMDPGSLTFVFASSYMNNPTSMFGHTFLRVNKKNQGRSDRLMATTVDYVASVPAGSNPIGVATFGVLGWFKGYVSTIPYYMKVKSYSDIDSRDMWEYNLSLTEKQIKDMLMHVWEMRDIHSDYFYFTENCSYNILSLLELVDTGLEIPRKFQLRTTPMDVIQLLVNEPELVTSVTFRPSSRTWINRMRQRFSPNEDSLFRKVVRDSMVMGSPKWKALAPDQTGMILDVASEYFKHHRLKKQTGLEADSKRWQELVNARLNLNIDSQEVVIMPLTAPPEAGHKTLKVGVGAGSRNGEVFQQLMLRAGYHDLLDPDAGYPTDAQIEMVSARVRHYPKSEQVELDQFTLLNIVSLVPRDDLFPHPSWKVRVAYESMDKDNCRLCGSTIFNLGTGLADAGGWFFQREVYFAFLEVEADYGRAFAHDHRAGGGFTIGILADLSKSWKMMLTGSYLSYHFGDREDIARLSWQQRLIITEDTALRMDVRHQKNNTEAVFSYEMYY